jgi:hypothetical protein
MTATFAIWLVGGLMLGTAHAWLIWKEAQPPFRWRGGVLVRLFLVGSVFVGAAASGELIAAALGWVAAYPLAVAVIAMRTPT